MNDKRNVSTPPATLPVTRLITLLTVLPVALLTVLPAAAQDSSPGVGDTAYVAGDYRVFTGAGAPTSMDEVVAEMSRHLVVFVGESHDDPTGHLLEDILLRRAHETYGAAAAGDHAPDANSRPSGPDTSARRPVALSLEFFQRDVQPILDEYLAGLISEESFRADSRPWPRYETDYRSLIEFAKENGLPVIAANAPRRYVRRVAGQGREALNALSPLALQTLPPLPYGEPSDEYRDQWIRVIRKVMEQEGKKCGLPTPGPEEGADHIQARAPVGSHAAMGDQLDSQVLWDATMAHSIAMFLAEKPDALVLHMVGGFHVARGTGTPEHLEAYRPGTSAMTVMLRPVDDIETFEPAPEGQWGDFVIQTERSRTLEAIECRRYLAELEG